MGGLKSLPETLLSSAVGLYFNFDLATAQPNGSINETMDTDQVTAILALFPGQNLQIFTNSAEFFVPNEPIEPPVAIKRTTMRGMAPGVPLFSITNAQGGHSTGFVGAGAGAIYEFGFNFIAESYAAPNLAANAGHIVRDIVDAAWRRHRSTDQCDMGVFPRLDGTAVVMVAMRDQEVTGFVPWDTQGRFLAAGCELNGDLYVAVARTLGSGLVKRTLERIDPARLLDSSVAVAAGETVVTGLPHLEGLTVCAWIDGDDWGDFVVTGGQITLPKPPQTGGEVGLNFIPEGTTQPGVMQQDPRAGGNMHPRVGDIAFRLGPSANLWAGLPGGKLYRVPMKKKQTISGEGPGQNAFSGWTKVEAVPGFRDDAQVVFTQRRPGPLQILEIVETVTT